MELDPSVRKWLKKQDKPTAQRIYNALEAITLLEDPRSRGKGLTGSYAGLWRYRIGDYRVICDIIDSEFVVVAIDADHRNNIYK